MGRICIIYPSMKLIGSIDNRANVTVLLLKPANQSRLRPCSMSPLVFLVTGLALLTRMAPCDRTWERSPLRRLPSRSASGL